MDRSGVPYSRRAVSLLCGTCRAVERLDFRPSCGRFHDDFQEKYRGRKGGRGRHTTMVIRCVYVMVVTANLALTMIVLLRLICITPTTSLVVGREYQPSR